MDSVLEWEWHGMDKGFWMMLEGSFIYFVTISYLRECFDENFDQFMTTQKILFNQESNYFIIA